MNISFHWAQSWTIIWYSWNGSQSSLS